VIPTYNRKKDVLECLRSLQKLRYSNYEIIVIDNGSTDGTDYAIKRFFPEVKLVKSKRNLGVTGGRNLGVKHSSGEYIFFLDHDTTVGRNALNELMTVMQSDSNIGIAGPIIYYYNDPKRIWALGTSINMLSARVSFNEGGKINKRQFAKAIEVQVLPTAFLVKREVTDKVGLFDDVFFAVYEDTDFCFRVKEAGYKVLCVPTAIVWHKVPLNGREQLLGVLRRAYHVARNRIIFMRKHAKSLNFIAFIIILQPIYAAYYTLKALQLARLDFMTEFWRGTLSGLLYVIKWKKQ
jgi:GT2 family glycosyltransferase